MRRQERAKVAMEQKNADGKDMCARIMVRQLTDEFQKDRQSTCNVPGVQCDMRSSQASRGSALVWNSLRVVLSDEVIANTQGCLVTQIKGGGIRCRGWLHL
ncbi:hypothetical protein vseg_007878 [Gypsophila vaccaria]